VSSFAQTCQSAGVTISTCYHLSVVLVRWLCTVLSFPMSKITAHVCTSHDPPSLFHFHQGDRYDVRAGSS
jgi:hypothetical protein